MNKISLKTSTPLSPLDLKTAYSTRRSSDLISAVSSLVVAIPIPRLQGYVVPEADH